MLMASFEEVHVPLRTRRQGANETTTRKLDTGAVSRLKDSDDQVND